jgi:hypothetical protein
MIGVPAIDGRDDPRASSTRSLEAEIIALLQDGVWRTLSEIAEQNKGGIGSRRSVIADCLRRNPAFVAANGRVHGRSARAVLYQLGGAVQSASIDLPRPVPDPSRRYSDERVVSEVSSGREAPDSSAMSEREAPEPGRQSEEIVLALRAPAGLIPRRLRIDLEAR